MKVAKGIIGRIVVVALAAITEFLLVYAILKHFVGMAAWIEVALRILSVLIVLYIIRNSRHLSFDMIYVLIIVLFPVPGTLLYLVLGADLLTAGTLYKVIDETKKSEKYYVQDPEIMDEIKEKDKELFSQVRYIVNEGFPVYRNTGFDYYGLGDTGWPVMLEEMKKAKKYIFMEYFIIEPGEMWDAMLAIMEQKVKEGVECRVMYDDMGSLQTIPASYTKVLEKKGIKAVSFNRVSPFINIIMNHRDHRKIMVIDGKTAFSGGVNLADEYINAYPKHGHWKDNVTRVTGNAVWSYLVMFLTNWNAVRHEDEDYTVFKGPEVSDDVYDGFIAPYGDSPLDGELTGQNIYMNILNQANDYVYIMTPYLIIDSDMINCLILVAKRGVDVHIVTPGIPDKKIVYGITRSYYEVLIKGGVHIHEYTPGFVHAKVFVADGHIAVVGTQNLDYRSLYLHFENGTYMLDCKEVEDVLHDVQDTMTKCHEITLKESKPKPFAGFFYSIVRLFASQM